MGAGFEIGVFDSATAWDAFVERSPQGSAFTSSGFLAALGETCEWVAVREGGRVVLGAPVLLRDGEPLPAPYPFTLYQGPMFSEEVAQEPTHRRLPHQLKIVEFFLEQLARRWPRISFSLHPTFDDLRAIQWFHYDEPDKGQFAIRLCYTGRLMVAGTTLESHLECIRSVRRQEFRKVESSGFQLEESRDLAVLDHLHELTFQRQDIARTSEETRLLQSIAKAALADGSGECLVARTPEGEAASAVLFLHDRSAAYYLIGANHPDFRKTGAASWLLLQAIDRARQAGRTWVDFVGINSPNRGDFKTSFGAVPVPYFNVTWQRPAAESASLPSA
jgi:GNAT superfamily N-acetyltransferase